jgi:holo-[acyl-carrier protein] synthase
MIIGIGVDTIELERIAEMLSKQGFIQRILTSAELEQLQRLSDKRQIEFVAGRFAAKEALAKALGTGIGRQFQFHSASILNSETGAPIVHWHEEVAFITHLSITHTRHYASAVIVLEEKK